jgi:hypothetical protein
MAGLTITSQLMLDGKTVHISGVAAYEEEQPPDPKELRRRGQRLAVQGVAALDHAPGPAEALLRRAIEHMVDAFLLDRQGNADLFVRAHELGALVEQVFSCAWKTDHRNTYVNDCGILALHSRLGLSPGGTTWGRCSLCGARDSECDHIPGAIYGGQRCARRIEDWDLEEVSMTQRPREPRCFRTWAHVPRSNARRAGGRTPGRCWHCRTCSGRAAPTADDLNPSRWDGGDDQEVARTALTTALAVAEGALTRPTILG